jgi:hypothetical protein
VRRVRRPDAPEIPAARRRAEEHADAAPALAGLRRRTPAVPEEEVAMLDALTVEDYLF